ncbi:MAG: hypothetical protein CVV25_07440 [Ignavibacteriae bacterium HGW-Ignavibacteriae-4]|jgi:hypothetical protein|nr:MAG: hypothetical protein CVV25_07440 [Ignavibacteriae bacterium HGW-Ignavibacteriae-4]
MSVQLTYGINNIFVDEYNLASFSSFEQDDELDFTINNRLRINEKDKFVRVETEIRITTRVSKFLVCKLVTFIDFSVENIKELEDKNSKEIILPPEFAFTLNSIAISTTRGILFSYNQGTYLDKVIMPLIDTSKIRLEKEVDKVSVD